MIEATPAWRLAYPGATVGVLAMRGVENPQQHDGLEQKKNELEEALRVQFSSEDRKSLRKLPVLAAYHAYYKRFGKTYHVQHQLESLVFKNRRIPRVAALVEAMFMAELNNLMLTAGHDLNAIQAPLRIDVANGTESYMRMNGENQTVSAGDMIITDETDVISCIIYGPDRRTRIKSETQSVVFTTYSPPGIPEKDVRLHLENIRENVMVIAYGASVVLMETFGTD
jgi:DNA/RNA-binding domain of Phe-tRNA-synthetase-like protein